jgi:nucleotide-binding universal stress UspA family protein
MKKILVPVDGSVSSLMAEETAAIIAKKTAANVTVLHVMEELALGPSVPRSVREEIFGHIEQIADQIIAQAKALFTEEQIKVETQVFHGDPAESILDFSQHDYDLTVMGACGEHEKDTCILGSVTKHVIRHTHCPTIIVKKTSLLSNLLVCTDGSAHSLQALNFGSKLAEKMGSNLTLLNVQEERLRKASPESAQKLGEKILSRTLKALGKTKVKVSNKLEYGVPSDVIVEVAEKGNHDLIVIGSRGLGATDRFLLGSVSDDVSYKAQCSVLIVPPEA